VGKQHEPSFTGLLTSLSSDSLTRGKQFERLVKWWLTQDPIWSRKINNVWLWDEWPYYPGRDIGIDLVAEMTDGTLCAVQAKCFDENRDIPKSELDSFISAASQRTFQHRLLVSTTDGLSANAKRMLADQHVVRVMRSDLESSLDVWPVSIEELSAPAQPHASPRPHQNLAITDVANGFKGNSRGQLIMACGTGKTLTALWIKETLKPKTTLVLVPSLNLLAQTLSEWAKNSLSPWQYLCVCSDDTVNKLDDQPISTVGDLPFEVTTIPADIAKFLSLKGERIIFSTYQSSAQVAKAQEQSGVSFDLVICDEAHRLTGKTDADYATVLDEKKIVGQKRLFMTATPRTYTTAAKTKAEDRGIEITSMDDEHVYGPVLHKLSFGEAIKQDLLSDYRVLIVGVTDPQVLDLIDRRELVSVNDSVNTDARTLAAHIGLAKATKDYNLKRTISFHSRIKSADQFAKDHLKILDWLPDTHKPSGDTWTGTISGAMNTGDRRRLIKQLSLDEHDRHALLTNARCLTEGVDVPSLDGVAFIDPRSSQVDIIQAVGRAIRKSKNKEIGTIVLPILIPTDSDAEEALEDTAFKPIWAILNALKSHDDELSTELNNLRTELGRTGMTGALPDRIVEDLPADIDSILPGFSNKLSVAILELSTSSWEMWFGLLQEYERLNDHAQVPHAYLSGDYKLGQWVVSQRSKYNSTQLEQDKIGRLESLKGWTWDVLDTQWNFAYKALIAYREEHGHIDVKKGQTQNGIKLRIWIGVQRRNHLSGRLLPQYSRLLEELEGWSWRPYEDQWNSQFEYLTNFERKHGHCSIPRRTEDLESLAVWVSTQRAQFRKGLLTKEQVAKLESLNSWEWSPGSDGFVELERFVLQFGHANVPADYSIDDFDLGRWCTRKRYEFQTGKISQENIDRLTKFFGWSWNPEQDEWDRKLDLLQVFAKQNLHTNPPKGFTIDDVDLHKFAKHLRSRFNSLSENRKTQVSLIPYWTNDVFDFQFQRTLEALNDYLEKASGVLPSAATTHEYKGKIYRIGAWVAGRRQDYRKGKLDTQYIKSLEAITNWTWNPADDSREEMFEALENFVLREGHASIPASHFEILRGKEISLGTWVTQRRMRNRKNQLEKEEIDRLNAIPGWIWDPLIDKFETGFSYLVEYVQKNGTAHVPTSEVIKTPDGQSFPLGSWCSIRRQEKLRGVLPQEKKERLESLQGWTWDPKDSEWMKFYSSVLKYSEEFGSAPKRGFIDSSGLKIGNWCDSTRAYYNSQRLREDRIALMEAIPNWSWNPHDESWEAMKDLLIDYLQSNDRDIQAKHIYKGKQLGGWVSKQRLTYKEGKLLESRRITLEGINGWSWERPQELSSGIRSDKTLLEMSSTSGRNWIDLLNDFIETEGHSFVPANYEIDGKHLGRWVRRIRSRHRNKTVPVEIVEKLEAISEWRWEIFEARWEDRLEELRQFAEQNGHISLSREVTDQNQLASWITIQRVRYHQERLTKTQIHSLETIPQWSWAPLQQTWETSFKYLLNYVNREGNANVPQDHFEDSFPLGRWVNKRRSAMKRGAMTEAEKTRLEEIPGWLWSPTSARKEEGFKLLQEFIDREGHARVPAKHFEKDFALGQWVTNRRQTYKRGKMLPVEQIRLESIQGWTWTIRK
jgi:superfamily II DNA or RNA helicase